jgi:hypothetical protein
MIASLNLSSSPDTDCATTFTVNPWIAQILLLRYKLGTQMPGPPGSFALE